MYNMQKVKNIIGGFLLVLLLLSLFTFQKKQEPFAKRTTDIPVVVICWNNYFFVKNFVNQLKQFENPIILLDNKSTYQPILDYYKEIKEELKEKIEIRLLEENFGHTVYLKLKDTLPDVYILSDPDLELNENMPDNFSLDLLHLSEQYNCYKVGCALRIDDSHKFIKCENYTQNKNIYDWEKQFWETPITNDKYEIYDADVDTTICLINNAYIKENKRIRVAGDFAVRHLPWYDNYIKNNISPHEINNWKKNNKSSSILFTCLKL